MSGNDSQRLSLTKANKAIILDTKGNPINNDYGKDGDHAVFIDGGAVRYGVKVNGSWWVIPMTKIP